MQRLERRICPGSVLDCGSGIKSTVKFETQRQLVYDVCDVELSLRKSLFDSLEEPNIFSLAATKLACNNNRGGRRIKKLCAGGIS